MRETCELLPLSNSTKFCFCLKKYPIVFLAVMCKDVAVVFTSHVTTGLLLYEVFQSLERLFLILTSGLLFHVVFIYALHSVGTGSGPIKKPSSYIRIFMSQCRLWISYGFYQACVPLTPASHQVSNEWQIFTTYFLHFFFSARHQHL